MKMKKRLLSILLSLALVLGLAPGMSLTAYADNPYTGAAKIVCTGTSTITNSGGHTPVNRNATLRYSSLPVECTLKDLTGGFNFANINSSSISQGTNLTIDNTKMTGTISDLGSSSFTLTTTGGNGFNYRFDMNLTVTALETYSVTLHTNDGTISEGKNVTSYVQEMGATLPTSTDITKDGNEFKGWFDNSGLTGNAVTSISTTDTGNKEYWAKWELAHTHSFTYTASGATITATCTAAGCNLPESSAGAGDHVATLTISANGGTYDGTTAYGATITDANSIQGDAKVQYQKMTDGSYGTATETAPKDAGDYKASITVGGATASVEYTIAQADPTANAPTGLTATYGQTLANVSLEGKNPEGNTPGTWAWADSTKSVGNVVTPAATFKAIFTPDSSNYKTVENVDVTVTVGKAANPATVTGTATVIKGGNTIDLKDNVTKNGATGNVGYAIDGEANGCTLNGSVLTSGNTTGTVTVNVTVAADSNYEALAAAPITVTINDKGTQTITAADVTASYGDTDKSVSASVTDPAQGSGAISYAVKDGSADYIDVNASTGALTIKKVPADGKAYVVVTAAETAAYAQATKDVTVTISKANAVAATVTANNRTYDGTEKPLVTVTGEATGGEMQYALGTATEATEQYTTSIPTATDAGTYYVWYKAAGDETHKDSDAGYVEVKIKSLFQYTVTFKVVNGSWNDGTNTDKTVTLSGGEGEALKLTADQIPAVGTKPNDGYQAGSWDVTPSTETAITGAITYTYTYAQRSSISQTVTFKVVNGSWDDNTAADKTVTLTGVEGDTLKLTADQIPAVGTKPNDGYQSGSWDVTPSTETAITSATTYTYTYAYAQRSSISQTVTFKVVNGSWDDNTAADKTVTLTGVEGDTLKLTAEQIPAVGTKPNDGYQTGSWDVTPSTETAITSATTYTYTYSTNEEAVTPSVTITTGNFGLSVESTRQLEVAVVPQGTAVTYSSSNAAVANVDSTGIVTAVAEGTAVITAKITVDGTDYSGTCTVTVSAIPVTVEEIPAHVHVYEWDTINATADQDGEMRYQCRICGDIQTRVPITAYYIFNKETTEKIRRAKQGETVKIETARWISFHKMVMEALADRPDVTLEVSFLDEGHKGTRKNFTIPAGTDTKSLVDDKGFAGFIFLTNKFGN